MAGSEHSNRGAARARDARKELGLDSDASLPDVLDAVEMLGGVHVVILGLSDGLAGAYLAHAAAPLVFVNGNQAVTRQRFTLAHEFGHHRMGHSTVIDRQTVIGGVQRNPDEVSANAFAAEFLMPKSGTEAWAAERVRGQVTLEHVVVFASEYGVSPQAARYAFATAGVLTSQARCDQLDAEIADELHIELASYLGLEPLEDSLADAVRRQPRIPAALEHSALGDLLLGAIDVDELAARAGRSPSEMQEALAEFHLDQLLPA